MINLNKKLTTLAFLTVTSAIGTILTVSNISAQMQPSRVVKDVTLWSKPNRQGTTFESNQGVPDLSQVGFDNRASSIAVNNGQKWRFYKDKNFKGEFIEIGSDEFRGNLGALNNQISSFKSVK